MILFWPWGDINQGKGDINQGKGYLNKDYGWYYSGVRVKSFRCSIDIIDASGWYDSGVRVILFRPQGDIIQVGNNIIQA